MNSKEMENRESDEEYSFLQETIRPQRKRQVIRYVGKVLATVTLAAIFGIVGAIGFHVTQGVIEQHNKLTERGEAASVDSTVQSTYGDGTAYGTTTEVSSDAATTYEDYWKNTSAIGKLCDRSIVSVRVNHNESWYTRNGNEDTVQSGVLFRKIGSGIFVLTEDTSVVRAKSLKVEFTDGAVAEAVLKGEDTTLGIAVLKVASDEVSKDTLKAINIQDLKQYSKDLQLELNQEVVCFGAPDGIMHSVIPGSIINTSLSAEIQDGRMQLHCVNVNYSENGNGFVADMNGNVIGMLTTSHTDVTGSINSAFVPVSDIADTATLLATGKTVAVLGVTGCDIQKGYKGLDEGVYVKKVVMKSPAYNAGLRVTDIIEEIGGYKISDLGELRACLLNHSAGVKLTVKVLRSSGDKTSEKKLTVTLE
jgi:S1-C subfamily serine protease